MTDVATNLEVQASDISEPSTTTVEDSLPPVENVASASTNEGSNVLAPSVEQFNDTNITEEKKDDVGEIETFQKEKDDGNDDDDDEDDEDEVGDYEDEEILKNQDDRDQAMSIAESNFFGPYDEQSLHFSEFEIDQNEQKIAAKKSEAPTVDRQMYYQMYQVCEKEYKNVKMKNNFLQRKLVDYYKKRRMDHLFKESVDLGPNDPLRKRYEKLLENFEELSDNSHREQSRIRNELDFLTWKRDHNKVEVENLFTRLQQMETDAGNDLVKSSATGSLEKFFERYLKRQKSQFNYMIKLRREYINIKNRYQEKLEALNALDHLGEGMHLSDYEQLKLDNRNHKDKLEEKENELTKLRNKCQNNIQILAHRREKVTAVQGDIETKKGLLEGVMFDYEDAREHLAVLKIEKAEIRQQINKMKDESGLLSKPTLLMDMQNAFQEIEVMAEQVNKYRAEYFDASEKIKDVRNQILLCKAIQSRGNAFQRELSSNTLNNSFEDSLN